MKQEPAEEPGPTSGSVGILAACGGEDVKPCHPFIIRTIPAAAKTSHKRWSIRCGPKPPRPRLVRPFPPRTECAEFRRTATSS